VSNFFALTALRFPKFTSCTLRGAVNNALFWEAPRRHFKAPTATSHVPRAVDDRLEHLRPVRSQVLGRSGSPDTQGDHRPLQGREGFRRHRGRMKVAGLSLVRARQGAGYLAALLGFEDLTPLGQAPGGFSSAEPSLLLRVLNHRSCADARPRLQ
jgi:hypothetical protein